MKPSISQKSHSDEEAKEL